MKKITTYALLIFSGLGLLKVFSITPFTRMAADDYSSAIMSRLGVVGSLATTYKISMGRFASILIETIIVKISGTDGRIILYFVLTFTLLVFSFLFFLKNLLKLEYKNPVLYLLAFTSFSVLYLLTPNKSQSWYWLTGSVTYLWPIAMFMITIAYFFRDKLSRLDNLVSLFLIFMATACNESFGFLLVIGLLIASILVDDKKKRFAFMMFAASSFSFLIMYLAPGNKTHAASYGTTPMSYLGAFLYSLKEGPLRLFTIFVDNYYVLIPLVFTFIFVFSDKLKTNKNLTTGDLYIKVFFSFLVTLLLSVFYMFPAFKNLGKLPPDRSHITLSLILLLLLILVSYYLANAVKLLNLNQKGLYKTLLLFVSMLLLSSSYVFTKDLAKDVYVAKHYSTQYDRMISVFKQRSGDNDMSEVEVSLPDSGLVPVALDPPGRYSFVNQALSEFFQIGKVVTVEYEEN